jgi:hypothetical protein
LKDRQLVANKHNIGLYLLFSIKAIFSWMIKSILMAYLFRVAINQGALSNICEFKNGFSRAFNIPFINLHIHIV